MVRESDGECCGKAEDDIGEGVPHREVAAIRLLKKNHRNPLVDVQREEVFAQPLQRAATNFNPPKKDNQKKREKNSRQIAREERKPIRQNMKSKEWRGHQQQGWQPVLGSKALENVLFAREYGTSWET